MILGKVRRLNRCAPFDASIVGFFKPHQKPEEHRDGQFVAAYDGDFVFFSYGKADLVKQADAVDALRELCDEETILTGLTIGFKTNPGIAAVGSGELFNRDFFQQASAAGGLARLAAVGGEAGDEGLQLLDFLLRPLVLIAGELLNQLARFIPEVIVAEIKLDFPVVDVDNVSADVVEKVTIVTDHQYRPFVIQKKVLQPDDTVQIEIVRRFVEQNDIRVTKERLSQQNLHLQARIQLLHGQHVKLRTDPEPLKQAGCVTLSLPAAKFGKFFFQFGGPQAVFIAEIGLIVDDVFFQTTGVKTGITHDNGGQGRHIVIETLVLLEDRHPSIRSQLN